MIPTTDLGGWRLLCADLWMRLDLEVDGTLGVWVVMFSLDLEMYLDPGVRLGRT